MVAKDQRRLPATLRALCVALSHPRRELLEILWWELLDNSLKLFNSAHGGNVVQPPFGDKEQKSPLRPKIAGCSASAALAATPLISGSV